MSVVSWIVSDNSWTVSDGVFDGFRSFPVVPRFSKYTDVLIKKV